MRNLVRPFIAAWLLVSGASGIAPASAAQLEFHVAIDGDDAHAGSKSAPFISLEGARDAVRDLKRRAEGLPPGGVRVIVHGGIHRRSHAFELSAEDSGTPEAPVVYAAAPE